MTVHPQQKARLSDFVLYAHPLLFLVPWQPAPYKPEWLGPLDAWAMITGFLLAAAMAEGFLSGEWLVSRGFALCASWFTLSIIVGVTLGIAGLDSVRQNVPLHLQAGGMIPYVDAFLVYYVIRRNRWGIAQFEKVFWIILLVATLLASESLLVFYLGDPLGLGEVAVSESGMFQSSIVRHHHWVGRLGILGAGVGLYFWMRRKTSAYLLISFLCILLAFSTLTRMVVFGLFIGWVLFALLYLTYLRRSSSSQGTRFAAGLMVVTTLLVALILYGGAKIRSDFSSPEVIRGGFLIRGFQYTRALDVLVSKPLFGAGPGLGYLNGFSRDNPPVVSSVFGWDTIDVGGGWAVLDLFREDPMSGEIYSLHSVPLNFIIDLGILGIAIFGWFIYRIGCFLRTTFMLARHRHKDSALMSGAILFTLIALVLSTLSTAKFNPYWLFVVLFLFVELLLSPLTSGEPLARFPS